LKMVLFKVLYLAQMIVIPSLLLDLSLMTTIWAFLLLTVFGSLVITLVLLSTHVGEDANFPEPNSENILPHSWSYHQVITAADFGTKSHTINLLFGGFNHHVIHHLFPHICHIHYAQLTPILIETADKYGLPYRSKKYLAAAVLSHFKLLKRNAQNSYQTATK
jgi:linoleoyl-CoA desaturase